ncbi:MAG: L-iditol 2-dehydrogenase [Desulfobacteraceae bacterium]|nr:MAG: L-iditol 2-dehydrogenase [Desulfobacteraceae bacterium]
MRSAVVAAPGDIRIKDVPLPSPGAGQVRVRLEGCGICASNLPLWEGKPWFVYPAEPGAPGHEAWGRIDAVGEGVKGLLPGKRVTMLSYHGFADYDVADAEQVVELPSFLDGRSVPGEPLGCAMNIYARSGIKGGETVAVIGIGFMGAILTRMALANGCRVFALARRPYALQLASSFGATTCLMDDHQRVLNEMASHTNGQGCDVVIEATGMQWPLDLAGELTKIRGRMVIAGYHQDGPRQVNMQLWNWRGIDVINAHEREPSVYTRGIQEAISAMKIGLLDPFALYTHTFPLERIAEGFTTMQRRPEGFFKAMVSI